MADYSNFNKVYKDFQALESLYKIYRSVKISIDSWGKTLWVNLNPQTLVDGMENFMKEYRKLPKAVRTIPTGVNLDIYMKQFKNIVPLMVSLRHEAMRERHWNELMAKTGNSFILENN